MKKKIPLPLLLADDLATGTDREKRSENVKTCASKIAMKLGCSIVLVHAENHSHHPVRAIQYRRLLDQYREELKSKLTEATHFLRVPTKPLFLDGEPAKKILSLAEKRDDYEMIVLGTQGKRGLNRLILGSVAEEVIRQACIPVMTVGPVAQEKAAFFFTQPKITILIPTSLTPNSVRAEVYGVSLARRLGGEVIFFHNMRDALHPVLQTAFSVPKPPPKIRNLFQEMKTTSQKQLTGKVEMASRKDITATYILDDKTLSASESVLQEAARSSASLIVMGTHGRSMASGAFFGRTVRDVILASPVPVITVHSKKA